MSTLRRRFLTALLLFAAAAGCDWASRPATEDGVVVVYAALDRPFAEPVFRAFTERTGITVLAQYDTESTKTVGLTNRIRAERDRPRCDVFWNNEILNTIALKNEGLLEASRPKNAELYPEAYRDPEGYWHGFAARARVLIVNTQLVPDLDFPNSIRDLASPRWKGKTGIGKPLFGTTASHIACLIAMQGEDETVVFLDSLKANDIIVFGGNRDCARAVADGEAAFGLTDTDDALSELSAEKPVRIVYPDSGTDGTGTLFLPNTAAVVRGASHLEEAHALVDFLLSAQIESMLAEGPSGQIPLHRGGTPSPRVKGPGDVRTLDVNFEEAARLFERARAVVLDRFLR